MRSDLLYISLKIIQFILTYTSHAIHDDSWLLPRKGRTLGNGSEETLRHWSLFMCVTPSLFHMVKSGSAILEDTP